MADNTIIQQGSFTSSGNFADVVLRSDLDWMQVYNYTQAATQQGTGRGVQFYWQRGMADDTGLEYKKTNATDALNLVALTSGGFTLLDTSSNPTGAIDATVSAVSTATPPVVTVNSTAAYSTGMVVRMIDVAGAKQLGGIDFSIRVLGPTTFSLPFMATIVAGTTGSFRAINFPSIFYPSRRLMTLVTRGTTTVVNMSVEHAYTVGQKVRFLVPAEYGMVELNNLTGTILASTVNYGAGVNAITVDIDSSSFTPFAFPLSAIAPFTPAQVVPVGEAATDPYSNLLDDATTNVSYIGMRLAGGAQSPAGSAADVIYWTAGKSFEVNNI